MDEAHSLLAVVDEVEARYIRYLRSTFQFSDPELARSFAEELKKGSLTRGPYLEASPPFERAESTEELLKRILPDPEPGFLKALQGSRPLYRHQAEAILRVRQGKNVVIATGTGSGKTEAFLYPILLHLYESYRAGTVPQLMDKYPTEGIPSWLLPASSAGCS